MLFETVELTSVVKNRAHNSRLSQALHEVVKYQPLIVPGRGPACLREDIGWRISRAGQDITDLVVELKKCEMRLGNKKFSSFR